MKYLLCVFAMVFVVKCAYGQEEFSVSFKNDTVNLARGKKTEISTFSFSLTALPEEFKQHRLSIVIEDMESTLPRSAYELFFQEQELGDLQEENKVFFSLKADSIPDRKRQVLLKFAVKDTSGVELLEMNNGRNQQLVINIGAVQKDDTGIEGFEYLGYLGTNFDLVEGIRAKNLFFATNILSQPAADKNKVGFYLSLFGNRSMTDVDSSGVRRYSQFSSVSDTSHLRLDYQQKLIRKRSTDNIGAYISPLVNLKWIRGNNPNSHVKLYYSPSLEFVWRRTQVALSTYGNPVVDSTIVAAPIPQTRSLGIPNNQVYEYSEYSFNWGVVGLFLVLENQDISVRVHSSIGYTSNYFRTYSGDDTVSSLKRNADMFFTGRAWITEPRSGITLQAEVTNTLKNPRPFFVTSLSKAFNFGEIATFFQPISK